MELVPIGVVHSPYRDKSEAPFQGRFSEETAELEIYPEYAEGLKDIDKAEYLIVLYWCHQAQRDTLKTRTPFGPELRGVFACRSPARPNPIAFCAVKLLKREGNRLLVQGIDAVDGSPLLDIKPYSSKIDSIENVRISWFRGDVQKRGEKHV